MSEKKKQEHKVEIKTVRHNFSNDEKIEMGDTLASLHGKLTQVILEEKHVSKRYKASRAELEARIGSVSTDISNGYDVREETCIVIMFPKEGKKRYWLQGDDPKKVPFVLEEGMSESDYQPELPNTEVPFRLEKAEEIMLFTPTESGDFAKITIGTARKLWFAVLNAKVGEKTIDEPLTPKTPASVKRYDSVKRAAGRFQKWALKELGKDVAKGFEEPASKVVEGHSERVE